MYQSVMLSATDFGLGLKTLSQPNLQKLGRMQNKAMTVIMETIKDMPIEATHYMLDLPQTRNKVEQSKSISQSNAESQEYTPQCCQRRNEV